MSTNFTGVTFPNQKVTPAYDAVIRRALLDDGILTGCALTYSGSTLTMAAGQLMLCGRQIIHPSSQNWAVTEATTGYARLVLTIDLTRTSTKDTFDQVVDEIQYATAADGFTALEQSDINAAGSKYQVAACVVSLGPGGITGIISQLDATEGGGAGGILTVTAPAGVAVTVSKDDKSKSKMSGVSGIAVFKGLASGTWTVTISDGTQTATKPVVITTDYSTIMAFFAATINITYPAGSTCTATDGTTTLTAPDTSGTWACVVPNAGTWTLSCTDGTESTSEAVTITTDGQTASAELTYEYYAFKYGVGSDSNLLSKTGSAGSASMSSEGITYTCNNTNHADGYAYLSKKYDISNYSVLCFDVESSLVSGSLIVGVASTVSDTYYAQSFDASASVQPSGRITVSVDVSTITGLKYIVLKVDHNVNNSGKMMKIYNIYMR